MSLHLFCKRTGRSSTTINKETYYSKFLGHPPSLIVCPGCCLFDCFPSAGVSNNLRMNVCACICLFVCLHLSILSVTLLLHSLTYDLGKYPLCNKQNKLQYDTPEICINLRQINKILANKKE